MEHEPILQMGSDRMLRTHYITSIPVKFHNKCEFLSRFNPDNEEDILWYRESPRPTKVLLVLRCMDESQGGGTACLGLHTMVFWAEIYSIKACIMENTAKGYTNRNIYILSDSQAALRPLTASR